MSQDRSQHPSGPASPDAPSPDAPASDAAAAGSSGAEAHDAAATGVFPRAVVSIAPDATMQSERESIASFGAEIVGAVDRIGLSAEEMIAVPMADRIAVLLDAPRSELLRAMSERMARAPEEIVIEALDRLFDEP